MGQWTRTRLIARKGQWFSDSFDHNGAACYELGTGGPRGGNIEWHYVGETGNESVRITCYAQNGSHLSETTDWHLKQGWCLYYRAYACSSKQQAKQMQDKRLRQFKYDWNIILNGD